MKPAASGRLEAATIEFIGDITQGGTGCPCLDFPDHWQDILCKLHSILSHLLSTFLCSTFRAGATEFDATSFGLGNDALSGEVRDELKERLYN